MPKYFVDKHRGLQVKISNLIPFGVSFINIFDLRKILIRLSTLFLRYSDKLKKEIKDQKVFNEGVYLSDVSPGDKPWDTHRANADQVANLYAQANNQKYSDRINECAEKLEFKLKKKNDNLEKIFILIVTKFCRVRFCPVCQWRRGLKMFATFVKLFPKIIEDYQGYHFLFLTLTVRNCAVSELRDTITKMNKAFVLLTKRKVFPGVGWVKAVEITRALDGSAHPHFHVILMVKPGYFGKTYLSKETWWKLWKDCLEIEYDPVIDIKKVKAREDSDFIPALLEVLKYSVKESDLMIDPQWLQAITDQLHKTRAISTGGVFKQYLAEVEKEVTNDEMIKTGLQEEESKIEEDDPSFWFGWRATIKRYQSE